MGSLLDYPVEIQGQGTLLNSGFKLESEMFQEGRNAGLEVFIRFPVKGKLAERRIEDSKAPRAWTEYGESCGSIH